VSRRFFVNDGFGEDVIIENLAHSLKGKSRYLNQIERSMTMANHKRLENYPGRGRGDFKPWFSNEEASQVVLELIKKGCVSCGFTGPAHETSWYPVTNYETGEQRLICYSCSQQLPEEHKKKSCLVCAKGDGDGVSEWHRVFDWERNEEHLVCHQCYEAQPEEIKKRFY